MNNNKTKRDSYVENYDKAVMTQGKYQGRLIKEIEDISYLEWTLKKAQYCDIDTKRYIHYKLYGNVKLNV